MLYLFDIDGTLVDTGGAGMASLNEATYEVFGQVGPPLDLAGSTDLGIISNIHAHFGMEPTAERIATYFEIYHNRLEWNLTNGGFPGRVLGGVTALLAELTHRTSTTVGLLTGNTAGGADRKMRHYGLSSYFAFGAFGSDHADRNLLGPIALGRAAKFTGRNFKADETLVIGDTPKDIACAHAMGARCLAVSTGQFSSEALRAYGADHVVESLDQAIGWIDRS